MLQPTIMNVSAKGQVVIPAKFRKLLGVKPKGTVMLIPKVKEKKVELVPMEKDPIESLHGFLKGKVKKSLTKELLEDRKKDLEYEERSF